MGDGDVLGALESSFRFGTKAVGRMIKKALETLLVRVLAPFDADTAVLLIDEEVSLVDCLRLVTLEHATGESANWRDESKIAYAFLMRAILMGRYAAQRFPTLVNQYMTVDKAREYIELRRPDLYELVSTEAGSAWLERNIIEIKALFTTGQVEEFTAAAEAAAADTAEV